MSDSDEGSEPGPDDGSLVDGDGGVTVESATEGPKTGSAEDSPYDSNEPEAEYVDIPEAPEAPEPPSTGDTTDEFDVPRDVFVTFWKVTLVVNAALLALSLGPMLAYFQGRYELGAALVAGGLAALAYAYVRYRLFKNRRAEDDD